MADDRHFEKVKSPYLRNRSTDFDEILHDDAFWVFPIGLQWTLAKVGLTAA